MGTYTYNISQALTGFGHEIHVITRRERTHERRPCDRGVHIHEVPWTYAPILFSTSFGKNAVAKLLAIGNDFDVVSLQCPYVSVAENHLSKINSPIVPVMHGTWKGERHGISRDRALLRSPADLAMLLTSRFLEKYEKLAMEKAAAVITISQFCVDELMTYGVPQPTLSPKLRVVPNGVNTTIVRPAECDGTREVLRDKYGIGRTDKMVLFVGRLVSRKGVDILIDAVAHCATLGGNFRFKLVIVGTGPLEGALRNQVSRKGVNELIIFTQSLNSEQLLHHYRSSDLFVLPSYYEGFGIVLLEAMASGLPVIATNVSAIPEVVIEGETGYLVKPGDPVALCHAIMQILENDDIGLEMGRVARALAVANYDWESVARKTEAIFEAVRNKAH